VIRFLADENLNRNIVSGLLLRNPEIDIVYAQDVGLTGADDETLLAWAAQHGRVVLTHDVRTIPRSAYKRIKTGQQMSGVLLISDKLPVSRAIEELLLISECSSIEEWKGAVDYLPL
jgi:hypothetical protein